MRAGEQHLDALAVLHHVSQHPEYGVLFEAADLESPRQCLEFVEREKRRRSLERAFDLVEPHIETREGIGAQALALERRQRQPTLATGGLDHPARQVVQQASMVTRRRRWALQIDEQRDDRGRQKT